MSDLAVLEKLFADINARRGAAPEDSYSAQLLADLPRAARKLGEEGVEAAVAATAGTATAAATWIAAAATSTTTSPGRTSPLGRDVATAAIRGP